MKGSLPRAILFDLGDTVLHTEELDYVAGHRALLARLNREDLDPEEVNRKAERFVDKFVSRYRENDLQLTNSTFQRLLYAQLGIDLGDFPFTREEMDRLFLDAVADYEPVDGIEKLLDFLQGQGVKKAILSNSSFPSSTLKWDLGRYGLAKRFKFVASSADYGIRKPEPALFQVTIKKLNLPPDQIWYVGDSIEWDVEGARRAGIHPVWFSRFQRQIEREPNCPAVDSWKEFLNLLSASP